MTYKSDIAANEWKLWRKRKKKPKKSMAKGKTVFMELYIPVIGLGGLIFIIWTGRLNLKSPLKEMFISYNKEKAQVISNKGDKIGSLETLISKEGEKRRKTEKQVGQIETKQQSGRFRHKYIKNHIKYNGLNGLNTPIKR